MRAAWGWRGDDAVGHGKPWKEERRSGGAGGGRGEWRACGACAVGDEGGEFPSAIVMRSRSLLQAFIVVHAMHACECAIERAIEKKGYD